MTSFSSNGNRCCCKRPNLTDERAISRKCCESMFTSLSVNGTPSDLKKSIVISIAWYAMEESSNLGSIPQTFTPYLTKIGISSSSRINPNHTGISIASPIPWVKS